MNTSERFKCQISEKVKSMANCSYEVETLSLRKIEEHGEWQCLRENYSGKCTGHTLMPRKMNGEIYTTMNCNPSSGTKYSERN